MCSLFGVQYILQNLYYSYKDCYLNIHLWYFNVAVQVPNYIYESDEMKITTSIGTALVLEKTSHSMVNGRMSIGTALMLEKTSHSMVYGRMSTGNDTWWWRKHHIPWYMEEWCGNCVGENITLYDVWENVYQVRHLHWRKHHVLWYMAGMGVVIRRWENQFTYKTSTQSIFSLKLKWQTQGQGYNS